MEDMKITNDGEIKHSRVGFKTGTIILFVFLQFFLFIGISHAASITWIAPSAGTWNTASNWSGGVVPGSADDVIFSASSTQPVTINQNVGVSSITMTSGYTGTITQGAYTVTLTPGSPSSAAYTAAGGTFNGGSGAMTVNGGFILNGGSFIAPANLTISGNNDQFANAGVFTPNGGTVIVSSTPVTITGSSTFYTLQIAEQGGTPVITIATGTTLAVTNDLQIDDYNQNAAIELLGGGQINVTGNIDNTYSPSGTMWVATSTITINLDGTGTQTLNGGTGSTGLCAWSGHGFCGLILPNLTINKSAGNVVFANYIAIEGNLTNQNATPIIAGTSTIAFISFPGTTSVITGSSTLWNFVVAPIISSNPYSIVVATGTALTVDGTFTSNQNYGALDFNGGGQINAQGDIVGTDAGYVGGTGGDLLLALNGTGTQNLIGTFVYTSDFVINKPSGSVTISGTPTFQGYGTWSNLSGTTINPGTSTVTFYGADPNTTSTPNVTITGSSTFYDLAITGNCPNGNEIATIATGTAITITNDLQMKPNTCSIQMLGGGQIDATGNIDDINPSNDSYLSTSTVSIYLTGTSTQTLNGGSGSSGVCGWSGYGFCGLLLPNLTINKSGGSVILANDIGIEGNFTNMSATPISAGTSKVSFVPLPGTMPIITGSSTFYNVNFSGVNSSNIDFTIATGTTLTVQNALTITVIWGYADFYGGGQIDVQGNIIDGAPGYDDPAPDGGGTVSFIMDGTSTQIFGFGSFIGIGGIYENLPNLTVNKTSGVVEIYGDNWLRVTESVTVQQGELRLSDPSGNAQRFTVNGPLTVDSGGLLSNYPTVSSTLYLGTSLTNNGTVFIDGSGNQCGTSIPDYAILNSTSSAQIPWTGTGTVIMRYANVASQGGSEPISVLNGVNSGGNNSNWSFVTGAVPQLVQETASSGPSGTSQLTLSFPNPWPRQGDLILVAVSSRNQSIAPPTDNASNTYYLLASSTFGSSPTTGVSLYYAKNVSTTQSFAITINGTSSLGSQLLSAEALEYTGMTQSSTLDTYNSNTDTSGSATFLTSNNAVGSYLNELYFGVATISTSTSVAAGSGWTSRGGFSNTSGQQGLYTEDIMSSSTLNIPATWTASTSTSYAGIIAVFRPPEVNNFQQSGTLDSQTLDTQSTSGAQLNSFVWQGTQPVGTYVKFQFAGSNSASGPWNFVGPDGTSNTYFSTSAGTPMSLVSPTSGYTLFSGYRYFRYRVTLYSDITQQYTPIVSGVTLNWSP